MENEDEGLCIGSELEGDIGSWLIHGTRNKIRESIVNNGISRRNIKKKKKKGGAREKHFGY